MRRRKKPKQRWKIKLQSHVKRKGVGVEDVYLDMKGEKGDVLGEVFPELENNESLQQEVKEIVAKVEEKGTTCPECGGSFVYAVVSSNPMGVGKTYTQRMRPFTIFYDVVCSKCGLVVEQATHVVHR